jgi:hypothetical protein
MNETTSNEHDTIEPEKEPEYVGAHSALADEQCQGWDTVGPFDEPTIRACQHDATHTIVMVTGSGLHEVAMCDDCGEPDDVSGREREWSGQVLTDAA